MTNPLFTSRLSLLARSLWVLCFVGLVFALQQMDVWNQHFAEASRIYLAYNLARIGLLGFIAWLWFFVGQWVFAWLTVGHENRLTALERWVIYSHLGAFAYLLLFLGLGYVQGYYLGVALAVTVPVLWLSYPTLKQVLAALKPALAAAYARQQQEPAIARVLFYGVVLFLLWQGGYLLLIKGIMPGLGSNDDWWQYYPYIQDMVQSHGIQPSHWYLYQNFITGNGGGLFVLGALLADVFMAQLFSLYFFCLMLGLLSLLRRTLTDNGLWDCLLWLLLLSSVEILGFEFYKNHIILNAFMMMMVYGTVRFAVWGQAVSFRLQAVFLAAALVVSPLALAFVVPIIVIHQGLWHRQLPRLSYSGGLLALALAIFASKLLINYVTLGMAELIPFDLFAKWANLQTLQAWLDPFTLSVVQVFRAPIEKGDINLANIFTFWRDPAALGYSLNAVFYERKMVPILLYAAVALLVLGLWFKRKIAVDKAVLAPLGLLLFTLLLMVVTTQFSIYRFSLFRAFFKVWLYAAVFILIVQFLQSYRLRHFKALELSLIVVLALYPLLKWHEARQIVGTDLTSFAGDMKVADLYTNAPRFFVGQISYADVYEQRWGYVKLGLQLQALFPDANILALNPMVGLYCIPQHRFQQGHMADFVRGNQYQSLLLGDPATAQAILQRHRLDFVLIDLRLPFWYLAYSPLFQADHLLQGLQPVLLSDDLKVAVLTWRSPADKTVINPRYNEFIAQYRQAAAASAGHFYSAAYPAVQGLSTGEH